MRKLNNIIVVLSLILFCSSCSEFDEINTNPDQPTRVSADMIATQVLKDTYRFWNPNPSDFSTGNLFNKHIALLETNPNPYQYYYSYYPYGSLGAFGRLSDLEQMVKFAEGTPQEPSFRGLALFLKASYGFNATLDMGDIPYSEAGKADEGITRPKYDKQEMVFQYILDDLEQAAQYFAEGENFGGDIMYGGDVTKWEKLANAMQLKVIQTMSKKASTEDISRFQSVFQAGNLMEGNNDNFKLVYTTNPNATYPFWNGEDRRLYSGVTELTVDFLKKNEDRRLYYFAEPAQAKIDEGLTESDYEAYVGALSSTSAETLALNNQSGEYSLLNKRYPIYMDNDPMLIFTYSEQCFIIAEAIEEGWISGDAKMYYEKGVKAMLEYYMNLPNTDGHVHGMDITQDYIDTYFEGDAAYAVDGSKEDRLKQILMQRWLIDFFQGNGGNYPQFLRTGYPEYPLNPETSLNPDDQTVYPKRWKYPTSEQTANPENYQKAIDEQYGGYDGINEVPWYLTD